VLTRKTHRQGSWSKPTHVLGERCDASMGRQLAAGPYTCAFRRSHSGTQRMHNTYEALYEEVGREEHGGVSLART
jgi:hypothetical protein